MASTKRKVDLDDDAQRDAAFKRLVDAVADPKILAYSLEGAQWDDRTYRLSKRQSQKLERLAAAAMRLADDIDGVVFESPLGRQSFTDYARRAFAHYGKIAQGHGRNIGILVEEQLRRTLLIQGRLRAWSKLVRDQSGPRGLWTRPRAVSRTQGEIELSSYVFDATGKHHWRDLGILLGYDENVLRKRLESFMKSKRAHRTLPDSVFHGPVMRFRFTAKKGRKRPT